MHAQQTITPDVQRLRLALAGSLVLPADPGYDEARAAWDLVADQRPAAVVYADGVADVQLTLAFAAECGLRVAPQGTGHHAASRAPLDRSILLRTDRMRDVTIDPVARTARAGAGALWGDVVGPAAAHGLMALAGSAADVGVVGYTLGGGMSWLARSHGLASNHVVAFDVVTADGRARRVDAGREPDLFWALRGGGGTFAVVTAVEFELFEVPALQAGAMFWPLDRAGEVLAAFKAWTDGVGEDVTSCWRVLQFPPLPELPEHLRGRSFSVVEVVHLGDTASGERLVAPLRGLAPVADTFGPSDPEALLELHMDPPGPVPGIGDGFLLDALSPAVQEAVIEVAGPGSGSPLLSVEIRHAGGALARRPAGHGALAGVSSPFALFAVGMAPAPEPAAAVREHVTLIGRRLAPWRAPLAFANFDNRVVAAGEVLPEQAVRLAAQVKAQYDPADRIDAIHPLAA